LSKWPASIWKNTYARQLPCEGNALNWHGQPTLQLQFEIWMPFMRQSTKATDRSFSRRRSRRWVVSLPPDRADC